MSSTILDPHIASTLTPEELQAINDTDDVSAEDQAALARIAQGGDDGDDEDEIGGNPDEVLDADGNPVETLEVVAPASKQTPTPATDPPPVERTPAAKPFVFKADLPADFAERITNLNEQESALRQQFREGDVSVDQYDAQRDEIQSARAELNNSKIKAELANDLNQQTAEAAAASFEANFMSTTARDGVDYAIEKNVKLFNVMLDEATADNAEKPKEWLWAEAHKLVLAARGLAPAAVGKPQPATRRPPLSAVPKTLAQVPGSDGPGDVGSEFAGVDALNGDELEDAIARMSPTQRAKYAAGR